MTRGIVFAIDPGSTHSAFAMIGVRDLRPLWVAKVPNDELLDTLKWHGHLTDQRVDVVAIEMVASYGMPVGREVFDTCVWVGRFQQVILDRTRRLPDLVYRQPVKLHHCHSPNAKDSNVTQALVDRFAPGQSNRGKGTKADPGWFYGFAADMWQAYALAVYVADTLHTAEADEGETP